MSSFRRSGTQYIPRDTVKKKMKAYAEALQELEGYEMISERCGQILDKPSFTTDIDSCCAFVIFNDQKQFIMGHYPSRIFYFKGKQYDLFATVLPQLLQEFKLQNKSEARLQALLVGGNTNFFNELHEYLKECKIQIVGTYLDRFDKHNFIEISLYNKTLAFFPDKKIGVIYSPMLELCKETLNHKKLEPQKQSESVAALRASTLLFQEKSGFTEGDVKDLFDNESVTPVIDVVQSASLYEKKPLTRYGSSADSFEDTSGAETQEEASPAASDAQSKSPTKK